MNAISICIKVATEFWQFFFQQFIKISIKTRILNISLQVIVKSKVVI